MMPDRWSWTRSRSRRDRSCTCRCRTHPTQQSYQQQKQHVTTIKTYNTQTHPYSPGMSQMNKRSGSQSPPDSSFLVDTPARRSPLDWTCRWDSSTPPSTAARSARCRSRDSSSPSRKRSSRPHSSVPLTSCSYPEDTEQETGSPLDSSVLLHIHTSSRNTTLESSSEH